MSRIGVTIEGGIFAADLVERIALGDAGVPGQQPRDFGIDAGHLSAEIQAAFSDIRSFWDSFNRRRTRSQDSLVTLTRRDWVIPALEPLGYTLHYQRAGVPLGGQIYPISHLAGNGESAAPVHIVGWDQPLGQRGGGPRSPHALLQEYLNHSDALWGIVTNGRELRLLRNSARSSRPSYIAVDLETILDGNLYNEFALVFRLLHRSRLPEDGADAHECLLERWYQQGIEEGGRVRDRLRNGVKSALEILGSGFLRHPANGDLCAKPDNSHLTEGQLYRELLNLIYRLLFLMVAEERRLLFMPDTGTSARHDVYLRWYGIERLRYRAERSPGEDCYCDLWEGLKQTFRLFRDEPAGAALALSALNGELFAATACIDLEAVAIRNDDLLGAIRQLSTFEELAGRKRTGVRRRVNYAGLDVEELGSIYESLLDYHPKVSHDPPGFALATGSERKATGSYYTPPELVRELIESALVPVMQDRLAAAATREAKERALLSLTILDPAAGSGHFLLAAARRVGRELAILRSGEAEPAPETYRAALRDVIRHCLYAVDKNPLAVDLCKVALWIEGHAPGLPLSFLDHRIRCGDSLVGVLDLDMLKAGVPDTAFKPLTGDDRAVCSELRKRNKREREAPLGIEEASLSLGDLAQGFAELADMPDGTPEEVQRKSARYRALAEDDPLSRQLRRACDAWTAAFFASPALTRPALRRPPPMCGTHSPAGGSKDNARH
jgi:N-6 DNA methylase